MPQELYGAAASPAEILNGGFPAPAEFAPLYGRLNQASTQRRRAGASCGAPPPADVRLLLPQEIKLAR